MNLCLPSIGLGGSEGGSGLIDILSFSTKGTSLKLVEKLLFLKCSLVELEVKPFEVAEIADLHSVLEDETHPT